MLLHKLSSLPSTSRITPTVITPTYPSEVDVDNSLRDSPSAHSTQFLSRRSDEFQCGAEYPLDGCAYLKPRSLYLGFFYTI